VLLVLGPLVLEGPEESFGYSVIVAVSLPAHRAFDTERLQSSLVRVARVLTTTITVVQQLTTLGLSFFDRISQGFAYQFGCQGPVTSESLIAQPTTLRLNKSTTVAK